MHFLCWECLAYEAEHRVLFPNIRRLIIISSVKKWQYVKANFNQFRMFGQTQGRITA